MRIKSEMLSASASGYYISKIELVHWYKQAKSSSCTDKLTHPQRK